MASRMNRPLPKVPDAASRHGRHHHDRPTGSHMGTKSYEKIHPKELPIITLLSGPNISHIRDAIQFYCQQNLGEISAIFTEGIYRPPATANYTEEIITADTTGILRSQAIAKAKRNDIANENYEKTKPKLHGILSSMTARDLDEKNSGLPRRQSR